MSPATSHGGEVSFRHQTATTLFTMCGDLINRQHCLHWLAHVDVQKLQFRSRPDGDCCPLWTSVGHSSEFWFPRGRTSCRWRNQNGSCFMLKTAKIYRIYRSLEILSMCRMVNGPNAPWFRLNWRKERGWRWWCCGWEVISKMHDLICAACCSLL